MQLWRLGRLVRHGLWLQQLHAAGLLRKSFRPAQDVLRLRYLVRHRDSLVRENASHVHRIQKVLTEMNLKLHHGLCNDRQWPELRRG